MHRKRARVVPCLLALGLSLVLSVPFSVSLAQTITSSGLNTTVSAPILSIPSGKIQLNITDGTRPGGGTNLFHSFGEFNVPTNITANFLNNTGLPTSNILGRVTGGNLSSIYGTIQTTGFGNANLFLMNPAGFLFGPNASLNVGGMVAFTSADYIRLTDNARFNVIAGSADALLTAAPVAAFGFLGSNPGAITVQGSQLSVTEGTGISLVGGNITVQGGTLTAHRGDINIVSVDRPSNPKLGGEVDMAGSGQGSGFTPTGFRNLGIITLSEGSTLDVSGTALTTNDAGSVLIRGGNLLMDNSSIRAGFRQNGFPDPFPDQPVGGAAGTIDITAERVVLNNSTVDTSIVNLCCLLQTKPGHITFNTGTLSATDSVITAAGGTLSDGGGAVTIQGVQGSGTVAQSVSLTNTSVITTNSTSGEAGLGAGFGGPILMQADSLALNHSTLNSSNAGNHSAGPITLFSRGSLDIRNSSIKANSGHLSFGTNIVDLRAGRRIEVIDSQISATSVEFTTGSITMVAPLISLSGSTLDVSGFSGGSGTISLTATKAVTLTNTILSADGDFSPGGIIRINGGSLFTSQQSTISAQAGEPFGGFGNGGTIQVRSKTVNLTDTLLKASTFGGPGSVGGSITVDAKQTTLTNSQILSTATEGQGGAISITSPSFRQDASSIIDASSQFGPNGTVTINGVVQP
jgi:filamentous hemagglutinin family protein